MIPHSIALVLTFLFVTTDCRLHAKHRLMRQQNSPQVYGNSYPEQPPVPPQNTFNSNQYSANSNPVAAVPASPPLLPPPPPPPPESYTPQPFNSAPANVPPPSITSFTPGPSVEFSSGVNPNYSPVIFSSKRRKKNVADKNNEITDLFESGKKMLDLPSENWKNENFSWEGDETTSNVTFMAIPGGMHLTSVAKNAGRQINANVNITSSSQKTISFGNSTEIENVVEMQMEKKIEDEKGDNQGSEEVRIIETERVKPVLNKNLKDLHLKKRKKKSYRKIRFTSHHRSKRSKTESTNTESGTIFDKMANNFFSTLVRKERVVKQNDLTNGEQITNTDVNYNSIGDTQNKLQSAHRRGVISDFINFFVKEMNKVKKSQENDSKSAWHSNINKKLSNKAFQTEVKRNHKTLNFPARINIVMNMNMSWESKIKNNSVVKSKRDIETHRTSTFNLNEVDLPLEVTKKQTPITLVFFKNNSNGDSRFIDLMFIATLITFFVASFAWIFPNMCRSGRVTQNSAARTYRFYHHGQKNRILGVEGYPGEKEYTEDCPKLEWQLEDGNWLSE